MKMLYLDATGVILAILDLSEVPTVEFAIKQLVPDANKYSVGQNIHMPNAAPVPPMPAPPAPPPPPPAPPAPPPFTPPPAPAEPPPANPVQLLEDALQAVMDGRAHALGYDDLKSACTYLPYDKNPRFAADGQAFRDWRSDVWSTAYAILAQVQAGERDFPTVEEAIALMPVLNIQPLSY